jgi:hypothetical protein
MLGYVAGEGDGLLECRRASNSEHYLDESRIRLHHVLLDSAFVPVVTSPLDRPSGSAAWTRDSKLAATSCMPVMQLVRTVVTSTPVLEVLRSSE